MTPQQEHVFYEMMNTVKRYISAGVLDPSKDMPTFTNQVVDQLMVQLNDQVKQQVASQVEEQMTAIRGEIAAAQQLKKENRQLLRNLEKVDQKLNNSWMMYVLQGFAMLVLGLVTAVVIYTMFGFISNSVQGFWAWLSTTHFGFMYVLRVIGSVILTVLIVLAGVLIGTIPTVFFGITYRLLTDKMDQYN